MPLAQVKLEYSYAAVGGKTAAVIVAAGSSSRMGGVDKQMLQLGGMPVVARTLLKFQNTDAVDGIVIVTKAEKMGAMQMLAGEYGISKLICVAEGGASRQESVSRGVAALGDEYSTVLIHDGARPLVKESVISAVASAAKEFGAAACGVRIYDTVKLLDTDGNICSTVDRNSLIRVQTPQGFDLNAYKAAVASCSDLSACTDDCAVMEQAGHKIKLIESDETNIKVTTPADIQLAERILSTEGNL